MLRAKIARVSAQRIPFLRGADENVCRNRRRGGSFRHRDDESVPPNPTTTTSTDTNTTVPPEKTTPPPDQELVLPTAKPSDKADALSAVLQDSNLAASTLQGNLTINLSDLVSSIPIRLTAVKSDNMSTVLTFKSLNLELTNLYVPPTNLQRYYELDKFNTNFKQAFDTAFPVLVESQVLFGVNVAVLNNLPFSTQTYLDDAELAAFRQITCLLFGLLFNINLNACTCFPKNLNELKAVNAGLGLNCVNMECRNMLKTNPLLFDDLVHTDCTDLMFNAAFVSLNLFAGKNINVDLNLDQTPGARARAANQTATIRTLHDAVRSSTTSTRMLEDKLWMLENFYADSVPVGAFFSYGGDVDAIPRNYVICRGQQVLATQYPELVRVASIATPERAWGVCSRNSDILILPRASNDPTRHVIIKTAKHAS